MDVWQVEPDIMLVRSVKRSQGPGHTSRTSVAGERVKLVEQLALLITEVALHDGADALAMGRRLRGGRAPTSTDCSPLMRWQIIE